MSNSIRVTPDTLEEQGNVLIKFGSDVKGILDEIDKKINEIDQGWDGLAQNAYTSMYHNMKKSLEQFPDLINALGETTKNAAAAYRKTDDDLKTEFSKSL